MRIVFKKSLLALTSFCFIYYPFSLGPVFVPLFGVKFGIVLHVCVWIGLSSMITFSLPPCFIQSYSALQQLRTESNKFYSTISYRHEIPEHCQVPVIGVYVRILCTRVGGAKFLQLFKESGSLIEQTSVLRHSRAQRWMLILQLWYTYIYKSNHTLLAVCILWTVAGSMWE